MHSVQRFLLAAGLAVASVSSFAATTVYTSSASFMAAVAPGSYTETFSGGATTNFSGGAFAYTASSAGGLYASGSFLSTNLPNQPLTLTFTSNNVTAIGGNFFGVNISDNFQVSALTFRLSDGTVANFTPASATDSFRGFTSTVAISSLTIAATSTISSTYPAIDTLTVGVSPVPEPATWLLTGLGVAGLLVARRRRILS